MSIVAVYSPSLRDTSIYAGIGARTSLSNTVTHNSNYVMKLEYLGPYVAVNVPPSSTVFFRVTFYLTVVDIEALKISIRTHSGSTNVMIYTNNSGILQPALVNLSATYTAATHDPLQINTWYTLEGKVVIHNSTGEIILKLNGAEILNLTGIDTVSAYDTLTHIVFTNDSSTTSCLLYLSDIIIADNWIGLGAVYPLVPTGNGAATAWTNDYAAVDEVPPSETDYISTDALTADTRESFTFNDLPANVDTVNAVAVCGKSKSTGVGGAKLKSYLRVGSSNYDGGIQYLDVSYTWHQNVWSLDPSDSNAWTRAKVNALEIGVVSA